MQMQRLLAEAVARQHQAVLARVPNGKRKGAAQLLHHVLVPLLVSAQQELGVRVAFERVTPLRELRAKRGGIEDRAVERERDAARRVGKRRRHHHRAPRLAVDDRGERLSIIAMRQRLGHGREHVRIGGIARSGPAGYAAHASRSSCSTGLRYWRCQISSVRSVQRSLSCVCTPRVCSSSTRSSTAAW